MNFPYNYVRKCFAFGYVHHGFCCMLMEICCTAFQRRALTRVRPREGVTKWSWRESRSALPLSQSEATERTLTRVRPHEGVTKWSWRESNPRPHKETIRFLHAYPGLHFRAATRPGPPIATLSSKISPGHRGLPRLFPI